MKKLFTLILALSLMASVFTCFAIDTVPGKDKWIATASSECVSIYKALDGDPTTYWHSYYKTVDGINQKDPAPFDLTFTLPEVTGISGFAYTPRVAESFSGRVLQYQFYVSTSDDGEFILIEEGKWNNDASQKVVQFTCNMNVKRVLFKVIEGLNGYGTMGEFDLLPAYSSKETVTPDKYQENKEKNMLYEIDKTNFEAICSSAWGSHTPGKIFDNNATSFWHENPGDLAPIELLVDMHQENTVSGFGYYPRQDDNEIKGHWIDYSVLGSHDGVNYENILADGHMDVNFSEKTVKFDKNVTYRYLKFVISKFNYHCACAELKLYQDKTAKESAVKSVSGKYVLTVGSNNIQVDKGGQTYTKTLDVAPYIDNGSTLIPLRGLLEEMDAQVEWNGDNQTINITKGLVKIEMQILNKQVYVTTVRYGRTRYAFRVAPVIKDNRTFIPLRFISEHLGYNVAWDASAKSITITNTVQ
ncbi:MAG: stalk domain-containing protein [Bacillota bacterium]|nr:stalk domain-containing protein [Bacillota bacterium]